MSRIIDHTKKYKIIEESQPKYPMPNLDEILPPTIYELEETLSEEEFNKFVLKHFNKFYSKYCNSSAKDLFVNLPLEFFTSKNNSRVRWYANIAFYLKAENNEQSNDDLPLPATKKYYENLHAKFLEMLTKKHNEMLAKKKHEEILYIK